MNEDQKKALTSFAESFEQYLKEMSVAIFIPNETENLLKTLNEIKSEFGL